MLEPCSSRLTNSSGESLVDRTNHFGTCHTANSTTTMRAGMTNSFRMNPAGGGSTGGRSSSPLATRCGQPLAAGSSGRYCDSDIGIQDGAPGENPQRKQGVRSNGKICLHQYPASGVQHPAPNMQRLELTLPTPAENVALDEALLDW